MPDLETEPYFVMQRSMQKSKVEKQVNGSTQRDMRGLLLKMEIEGQRSIGFSVPASESMSFL